MKKKRWITLIILIIIVWIWTTYFLYIKELWKSEKEFGCQNFIDECYKKNFEFWAWGWHMFELYPDWSTSLDDMANCPQDCSRYTEERWYFKNEKRQEEYYKDKVEECEKEYEKCKKEYENCLQKTTWSQKEFECYYECHECNKYWEPIYLWN